jgi:hypothetical protein
LPFLKTPTQTGAKHELRAISGSVEPVPTSSRCH